MLGRRGGVASNVFRLPGVAIRHRGLGCWHRKLRIWIVNTRSLVVLSLLLQATLLSASGCATQAKSSVGPNANQPQGASAECKVDAAHIGQALSRPALLTRNDLFARLCSSPDAQLVDVTDPTLA